MGGLEVGGVDRGFWWIWLDFRFYVICEGELRVGRKEVIWFDVCFLKVKLVVGWRRDGVCCSDVVEEKVKNSKENVVVILIKDDRSWIKEVVKVGKRGVELRYILFWK